MVRQVSTKKRAELCIRLADIIRMKADSIGRAKQLGSVRPEDVKMIKMLPMDRIRCVVGHGIALYVNDVKETIQIADPLPLGGNDCKHINRSSLRNFKDY